VIAHGDLELLLAMSILPTTTTTDKSGTHDRDVAMVRRSER
jgi:hypothetical protein